MKTKTDTFYTTPDGETIIFLKSDSAHFTREKFYYYGLINKKTGPEMNIIDENKVDDFFKDFVLLDQYALLSLFAQPQS